MNAPRPSSNLPCIGNYDSTHLIIGAGVAIFHLATARVVLCWHSKSKYWFLPKGRRDVNEDTGCGAEREGYEESGYYNRLLPIDIRHRQPRPHPRNPASDSTPIFVCEPVWTQLHPSSPSVQYILFWYIAETIPPDDEASMKKSEVTEPLTYQQPPRFPAKMTLAERIALEPEGYEPIKHENTGVNAEEALYESYLLPIDQALLNLGKKSISGDVIRRGWAAIYARYTREEEHNGESVS